MPDKLLYTISNEGTVSKGESFPNLLGIKKLVPSKLKLGYVALAPEDFNKSLPFSQREE